MKKTVRQVQLHETIIVMILCVGFVVYSVWNWQSYTSEFLTIVMLDIGQGDALYIRTPQGTDLLIDGGADRRVLSELGEVMPPQDHQIEVVIATHPDADHIAGLTELPEVYDLDTLITSGTKKQTGFSQELSTWNEKYGVTVVEAYRGWRLNIEEELWLEFLNPNPPHFHKAPNEDSVMFVLHFKEFSAFFTGDASTEVEHEIVEEFGSFDIDILKVGHHGSKTSTSATLLDATTPEVALISVGAQNKFGHPHFEPVHKLEQRGIQIFRTDVDGRVLCTTDGREFRCQ